MHSSSARLGIYDKLSAPGPDRATAFIGPSSSCPRPGGSGCVTPTASRRAAARFESGMSRGRRSREASRTAVAVSRGRRSEIGSWGDGARRAPAKVAVTCCLYCVTKSPISLRWAVRGACDPFPTPRTVPLLFAPPLPPGFGLFCRPAHPATAGEDSALRRA